MKKNDRSSIFYLFFLILLAAGGLGIFISGEASFSANENRYLRPFSDIIKPGDAEPVLADQFPWRDHLLALSSELRLLSGEKEINDTYIGKDGYLFDACSEEDFPLKQYQQNMACIRSFADRYRLPVDFVPVPSPYVILSEKLPDQAPVYDAEEKYNLARDTFQDSGVKLQDMRPILTKLKAETQVYYRTDHHWTSRAAAAVCRHLCPQAGKTELQWKTVSDSFYGTMQARVLLPGLRPDTIEAPESANIIASKSDTISSTDKAGSDSSPSGTFTGNSIYHPEKLKTKDQYAYFLGGNQDRVDLSGTGKGKLLLIKDSYANCMIPLLLEQYAQITVIDLRYYNDTIPALMEKGYDHVWALYEMTNFAGDNNLYKLAE